MENQEKLNQPGLQSERLRSLYQIKRATGKPLDFLIDETIQEFAASFGTQSPFSEQSFLRNADQETWEEICEYRRFLDELNYQKCLVELEKIKRNG